MPPKVLDGATGITPLKQRMTGETAVTRWAKGSFGLVEHRQDARAYGWQRRAVKGQDADGADFDL